jgi:hypothetical protein
MLDGFGLQISSMNNAMAGQFVLNSDVPATDFRTSYKKSQMNRLSLVWKR